MGVRGEIENPSRRFVGRINEGMKGHTVFELLGRAEDVEIYTSYMEVGTPKSSI